MLFCGGKGLCLVGLMGEKNSGDGIPEFKPQYCQKKTPKNKQTKNT
jgi:hypothetical protein